MIELGTSQSVTSTPGGAVKKSGLVLMLLLCCALVLGVLGCSNETTTTASSETTVVAAATTTTTTQVPNTWTDLSPVGDVPSARTGHSMVYDSTSRKVVLFGGNGLGFPHVLNDTLVYDPATNTWTELRPAGDLPLERIFASMVYDSGTGRVILFGGSNGQGARFNDTWAYYPPSG
jgi:N-acetylneuraminic acid mutarotase